MSTPLNMLDAFRASVARRPAHPALHFFQSTMTFGELDVASDAFAVALLETGFERGDRVALYLQNDPQFVVAALGAWKAGGIAVATSPMLKHKELTHVLGDSGARVLVALESLWRDVARSAVDGTAVETVVTASELDGVDDAVPDMLAGTQRDRDDAADDLAELVARHAGQRAPDPGLGPDDVAFLTYTSGTTGPAKGAMNTHGNLLHGAATYRDEVGLDGDDVILGVAPLFHITGITAHLALGLLAGIPVVLTHRFDVETVLQATADHGATFTVAAITAYVALMSADAERVRSLRRTLSGGAPIAPSLADDWERHAGVPLVPVYGLTETSGPTHLAPIAERPPVHPDSGALAVGRAVPGTTVRILGEDGRDCPPGTAGEIVVAGPQVVPGYWQNAEQTAHAFTDGAMRTGDIGIVDEDGWCYVVDRKKDLIIASGYKVWPREVEDGLLTHPAVREAAVVGVPDSYRGESVAAFVSLARGAEVDGDTLVAYCRERMAAYKYPRVVEVLAELPKSPAGKILRRVLRDEARSRLTPEEAA